MNKYLIGLLVGVVLVSGCFYSDLREAKCNEAKQSTYRSLNHIDDIIESREELKDKYNVTYDESIINWSKQRIDTINNYNELCGEITGRIENEFKTKI